MSLCAKFHTFVPICAILKLTALTIVRREPENAARKAYETTVKEKRNRGRHKLQWSDAIQSDMEQNRIAEGTWKDRHQCRKFCRTADPV